MRAAPTPCTSPDAYCGRPAGPVCLPREGPHMTIGAHVAAEIACLLAVHVPPRWFTGSMPTSPRSYGEVELGRARERRWWVRGRRVRSIARAGAFVEDVGFALLFPSERVLARIVGGSGRCGRRAVRYGDGRGRAARVVVEGRPPAP